MDSETTKFSDMKPIEDQCKKCYYYKQMRISILPYILAGGKQRELHIPNSCFFFHNAYN